MRKIIVYFIVGIVINAVFAIVLPNGLFFTGGILTLFLFSRVYMRGGESSFIHDLYYAGSIIAFCGLSAALLSGYCFTFPSWKYCKENQHQASIFAIVYFPLIISSITWAALRLPKIVKSVFKK